MSLILPQGRAVLFVAAVLPEVQRSEIIQDADPSAAKDLDPLFGISFVTIGKIIDGTDRTVCKKQLNADVVFIIFPAVRQTEGIDPRS